MSYLHAIRKLKGLGWNKRGTAVIEFAIVFPILIVITLMIFDLGRAMFFYTTVNHLAAEGVRFASVHGLDSPTSQTQDEVEAYILSRAAGLSGDDLTVTITYTPDASSGSEVEVTVEYDQNFFVSGLIIGLLGENASASITLTGESQMRIL